MNNFFDNNRILKILWLRKYHLLIVAGMAIVLAALFSSPWFIKPKYKSTARIYPTNLLTMSEESQTEQMLEIINSQDIKLRMFDAFDLANVYKIPKNSPYYMTYMLDKYKGNVSTSKTEYETVELRVLDEDPKRACTMCDSLIHFYNLKVGSMHRYKFQENIKLTSEAIHRKYVELDTVENKLNSLRKDYGIIDFGSLAREVTKGYMEALATGRGSTSDAGKIKNLYDNLADKGAETRFLEVQFNKLIYNIDSLKNILETFKLEADKNITYCHIVQTPIPADKKSYPVRWLIVFFSTVSAVFLASLVFLILDYRKENS